MRLGPNLGYTKISAQLACVRNGHRISLDHGNAVAFSRRQAGSALGTRAAAAVRAAGRQAAPGRVQAQAWQEAWAQGQGSAPGFASQEAATATRAASGTRGLARRACGRQPAPPGDVQGSSR